jgi:hypothetical protein
LYHSYSSLSNDKTPISSWATGTNTNWTNLKQGFKGLSVHFEKASEAAAKQVWCQGGIFSQLIDGVCINFSSLGCNLPSPNYVKML